MQQVPAQNSRASWLEGGLLGLAAVYFVLNLLRLGGDAFVFRLNNMISVPLALSVMVATFLLLRGGVFGGQQRLLWFGLALGWLFWTVAEVWWAVASWLRQDVPYPSGADLFWLVGYLPMYMALWERIQSLPRVIRPAQKSVLWLVGIFSVGGTVFFVFAPILKNADVTAILESTLNILYPLADLVLLNLVLRIFLTFENGMYGKGWTWLAVGFIFHSVSDLLFSYATTANLYYPEQQANGLSTVGIDVPYNLAYVFWLVGLFLLQRMPQNYRVLENDQVIPRLAPNTHVVIFTKSDDRVTEVSRNFSQVFADDFTHGKTLSEILGVETGKIESWLPELKRSQILKERPVVVQTRFGQREAWLSGIAVTNPQGEYSGSIFLMRLVANDPSLDDSLTDYQKGMVRFLLQKVGVKEEDEIKQALAEYYRAFLRGFYNRALSTGGSIMAETLITTLETVVKQNHWQIAIQPENLLDINSLSLAEAQQALPALYETAKQFIAQLEDEQVANQIVQEVSASFDQAVIQNLMGLETHHTQSNS